MTGFNYSKSHTQKDRFRLVETAAASKTTLKGDLAYPRKGSKLFFFLFDKLQFEVEEEEGKKTKTLLWTM